MEDMPIRRYALLPESDEGGGERGMTPGIRRYHLARVAVTPRSDTGVDRHARMERVAGRDRDARPDVQSEAGGWPAGSVPD